MVTIYQMDVNELSMEVLNAIKTAFKNKTISITVTEVMDETEYLLSSENNKTHLEKSIREAEEGNTTSFTVEEFKKQYGQ
jgi:predicted P-loop ATPase/GTPase